MPATLLESWNRTVLASPESRALIDAASGRVCTRRELDALAADWRKPAPRPSVREAGPSPLPRPTELSGWRSFWGCSNRTPCPSPSTPANLIAPSGPPPRGAAPHILLEFAGRLEPLGRRSPFSDGRRLMKLTSGSTGKPRGLAFTDGQMLADGRNICAAMGIRPDDLNLGLIPFGHSYGLGNLVVPLLAQGTAVVCSDSSMPQAVAATVEKWGPTVFPAVPALLRALAETSIDARQLRSLRTVISAGAPLDSRIARSFHDRFGRKLHSFYGSSETGGITYDRTGDATLSGRSVGTPLDGVRLAFGRPRPLHRGRRGGLHPWETGAGRAHRPSQPRRSGSARREWRVGAARTHRPLREKSAVGASISPRSKRALRGRLPGVRDAFAAQHAERADALAAVIAGDVAADSVRSALRERLAPWKIPRKVVVLREFPLTTRGKTDTRRLREMLADGRPSPA